MIEVFRMATDPSPVPDSMQFRTLIRRICVAVPILLATAYSASLFGILPWSRIKCEQDEVDILSGRTRHTSYLFYMPIHTKTRQSPLSRAAATGRANDASEWHLVNTFSPGLHHSPHYYYHGALSQIRELELCWERSEFTPEAKKASARALLRLWQDGGGYTAAHDYLEALDELAREGRDPPIGLRDLPDPRAPSAAD